MIFAYNLGDVLGLSSIQRVSIKYPTGPTLIQIANMVLFTVFVLWWPLLNNFNLCFLWCIWIGSQGGTCYTNFMFLANAKTNLPEDMNLNFYERELVVNLLLISQGVGTFFAAAFGFFFMQFEWPEMLYNPPG